MSLLASVLLGSTENSVELLSKEILDVIAAILRIVTSSLDIECVLLSLFFPPFDKYHMLYCVSVEDCKKGACVMMKLDSYASDWSFCGCALDWVGIVSHGTIGLLLGYCDFF